MRIKELKDRLKEVGAPVTEKTLRQWGEEHKIENHQPNPFRTGRGHAEDWPEKALEEACAMWALRNSKSVALRLSPEIIETIKRSASLLYISPYALYTLPPMRGGLLRNPVIPYEQIKMTFISERPEEVSLFPGENDEKKFEALSSLIITWIAALEKVRWTKAKEEEIRHVKAQEREEEVLLDRWPMKKPACVNFWYQLEQLKEGDPRLSQYKSRYRLVGRGEFRMHEYKLMGTTLSKSDKDNIRLYENGVDTRKLFKIAEVH